MLLGVEQIIERDGIHEIARIGIIGESVSCHKCTVDGCFARYLLLQEIGSVDKSLVIVARYGEFFAVEFHFAQVYYVVLARYDKVYLCSDLFVVAL